MDVDDEMCVGSLLTFVRDYIKAGEVPAPAFLAPATARIPRTHGELLNLESTHKVGFNDFIRCFL